MKPAIELEGAKVFHGSCLDVLPTLPDNSIDAVVCDPPYELGFMGKSWDSSGIAYNVEVWRECLRVLKPGGHLLAFGGSRTWHRIAVAIEDAGFDIRDSIAWMYGSGFPKSLDISKAIDKRGGVVADFAKFRDAVKCAMNENGVTQAQLRDALGNHMLSHYLTAGSQPAVPNYRDFKIIRDMVKLGDSFDYLFIAEAEREVIGTKKQRANSRSSLVPMNASAGDVEIVTAPATPEAVKWQGWGTALKPAFEPVVVARKPLIGTVAANVLEFGTGGLNIDGSRIGRKEGDNSSAGNRTATFGTQETQSGGDGSGGWEQNSGGRWPANVILDEYTAALLDEQSGVSVSRPSDSGGYFGDSLATEGGRVKARGSAHNDSGGASRFFYVAKASKRDRNEGLDELPTKQTIGGGRLGNPVSGAYGSEKAPGKNFHPTVKPTDLMRYLVKLVTPPGGTVLDPFTGSGSTGKAAILEGFEFVGIELTEEYLPIIEGRLRFATETVTTEAEDKTRKESETLF